MTGTLYIDGEPVSLDGGTLVLEPNPPREPPAEYTFTFTAYVVSNVTLAAPTSTPGVRLTLSWAHPRNPPIGVLRAWAAQRSSTPWRRRSIASWRHLWRVAKAGTVDTVNVERARFESDGGSVRFVAEGS